MPTVRITWLLVHERPLEADEPPFQNSEAPNPDALLWAYDDSHVEVTVEFID